MHECQKLMQFVACSDMSGLGEKKCMRTAGSRPEGSRVRGEVLGEGSSKSPSPPARVSGGVL